MLVNVELIWKFPRLCMMRLKGYADMPEHKRKVFANHKAADAMLILICIPKAKRIYEQQR